jgi:DNA-binding transcriptional LysR family regulator
MELRELRVLVAVADYGSVSRAAKELHQSPSSVSQTLAALEAELDVRLFTRVARGMVPTDVGKAVLEPARRVLREAETTRTAAASIEGLLAGTITVMFPRSTVLWVADLVSAFHADHPRVSFRLHPDLDTSIPELLRRGECDIGIMRTEQVPDDLATAPVGSFTPMVVVPEGHALARRPSLRLDDLDGVDMVAPSTRLGHDFEVMCKRANVTPNVVAETDHPEIALALIRAGLGVSILPAECAAIALGRGVVIVPFAPAVSVTLAIVSRHDEPLAPAAEAFRALAVDRYQQVAASSCVQQH